MGHSGNSGHSIFISHASQDASLANKVCAALEAAHHSCWVAPRDVQPGEAYAAAIVEAINFCRMVVLILSRHAVESPHVLREVERASSKRRPVLVIRTDVVELTRELEYFLSAHQWLDASNQPIEKALPALLESVRSRAGDPATLPPGPQERGPDAVGPKKVRISYRAPLVLLAVLALPVAYWVANSQGLMKRNAVPRASASSAVAEKPIAVLPFVDLSPGADQAYVAEGIAAELARILGQVPSLRVIGTASSFRFKGNDIDVTDIGKQLKAAYLVQGSVEKSGNHLKVLAHLTDADSLIQRWAETYDRSTDDILKVQEDIATSVARALQITVKEDLGSRERAKNPYVYDLYLKGIHAADVGTRESLDEAAADFQQALNGDPDYAEAAVGLAKAQLWSGVQGWIPPRDAFEGARHAAETALRLEPSLANAHAVLATVHIDYDWDLNSAQREIATSLQSAPHGNTLIAVASAELAANLRHWDEAARVLKTAMVTDPLAPQLYENLVFNVYLRCHRYTEAEAAIRRALAISPNYGVAHYFLGESLLLQGRLDEALIAVNQETIDDGRYEGQAMIYYAMGRKADSDAALLQAKQQDGDSWPSEIARVYAFRGELDEAMQWLNRAFDFKDEDLYAIRDDPLVSKLEGDARYKSFLKKLNFSE